MNFLYHQKGQSIIELLVAIGIFMVVICSVAFLILDSYVTGRLGAEITKAGFLAQEGMEAARSIRDNSWDDLTPTFEGHGLVVSGGHWVFEDIPEAKDVSGQLREGERKIIIENISSNRKKITSQVSWQFTGARPQEIQLVTYLTNWENPLPPYLSQLHYRWREDNGGE